MLGSALDNIYIRMPKSAKQQTARNYILTAVLSGLYSREKKYISWCLFGLWQSMWLCLLLSSLRRPSYHPTRYQHPPRARLPTIFPYEEKVSICTRNGESRGTHMFNKTDTRIPGPIHIIFRSQPVVEGYTSQVSIRNTLGADFPVYSMSATALLSS